MPQEIYLGNIGTLFRLRILDQDDSVVNLSTASTMRITFRRPDDTTVDKTATFTTDGTDGYIEWASTSGFLDQEGTWRYQGFVVIGVNEYHANPVAFEVARNL